MAWSKKQLQILNVAETLFAKKGYEGTSVRDIADAAGVNLAMISYYFGSKEKLLYSLIRQRGDVSAKMLEELNKDSSLSPWQKMERVIDFYVDMIFENRDFHTIANRRSSLDNENDDFTPLLIGIKKRNAAKIIEILEEGKKEDVFNKVNNELTIGTIMGTINQTSNSRKFYATYLNIPLDDEDQFYTRMNPILKKHLKQLLHAHLVIKPEKINNESFL